VGESVYALNEYGINCGTTKDEHIFELQRGWFKIALIQERWLGSVITMPMLSCIVNANKKSQMLVGWSSR